MTESTINSTITLRDQGLCHKQLSIVFDAVILSRIMYAVCAWSSFLSQEHKGRIDAFLRRMHNYGFCQFLISKRSWIIMI
jgi:hypothetical protein